MVKWEHQIDSQNRGLVGEGAGEAHRKKALEEVAERSSEAEAVVEEQLIEAKEVAVVRLIGVKEVAVVRLIEAKAVGAAHSIVVTAEGEEVRCLLTGEEVRDVTKPGVMEERVRLAQKVFSVVVVGEGVHLLVERHEHEMAQYLLREAGVELYLDLVLEVVLYFFVP